MSVVADQPTSAPSASFRWAGYTLGFSIGGFFDGILLHQVLQWHHLLSSLEGDLRFQILADGLFHVLMYVIAGVGLWLLWRARREFGLPKSDRLLFANALVGFGVWHVLDSVASHWILGIHRIRMDSDVPLVWDLIWFGAFGLLPLALGWFIRPSNTDIGKGVTVAPAVLAAMTFAGATGSALPPGDLEDAPVVVLFRPGITPAQAAAAMASVEGRLIWSDASDQVWALDVPQGTGAAELYAGGALLVSRSLVPRSCLDWFRT